MPEPPFFPFDPGPSALPLYRATLMGLPGANAACMAFALGARQRDKAVREHQEKWLELWRECYISGEKEKDPSAQDERELQVERARKQWERACQELEKYTKEKNAPWLNQRPRDAK